MSHDYAKDDWYYRHHHQRYCRFVESRKLICQECHGAGGEVVPVLDYGQGPWEGCGFCEGAGYVSPWLRGWWLRWKRDCKRGLVERIAA